MSEQSLERRLRSVADALDATAPSFDPAILRRRRPVFRLAVAVAVVAGVVGVTAAPAAISALADFLGFDEVEALGPTPADVAPGGYRGTSVPAEAAQATVGFRIRTIAELGSPDAYWVRDDFVGGMAIVEYGGVLLTQWPVADVDARVAIVPSGATADVVENAGSGGVWIEGTARGTLTVIGADGGVHREAFDVAPGALVWRDGDVALLLQGAGSKAAAVALAAGVR
jgi:hypothetical protein